MSRGNFSGEERHGDVPEPATNRNSGRSLFSLWEVTQSIIAFAITGAIIFASLTDKSVTVLGTSFTLIIALYFVGVNKHER